MKEVPEDLFIHFLTNHNFMFNFSTGAIQAPCPLHPNDEEYKTTIARWKVSRRETSNTDYYFVVVKIIFSSLQEDHEETIRLKTLLLLHDFMISTSEFL